MRWHNFTEALPAEYLDIVIVYINGGWVNRKFHICKSHDYMKIIGENNIDMRFAYWAILDLDDIDASK